MSPRSLASSIVPSIAATDRPVRAVNSESGKPAASRRAFIMNTGTTIRWDAESRISEFLDTSYHFTADGNLAEPIGPLRILQYLDGGIQGSDRDLFIQITDENPLTAVIRFLDNIGLFGVQFYQQNVFDSTFVGSAVDRFNQIQERIQGSGQPVSIPTIVTGLPGFQFSYLRLRAFVYGPANLTSVLAWDVNPGAHSTFISTTLEGAAALPPCEPNAEDTCGRPAVKPAKDQFLCRTTGCAIPVTCKLPTQCKTKTKLFVTPESIRLKNGLAVKAQRRINFAAAVTNIPPGATLTVRPKLTKQGKRLVRANKNRIIDGVMSIRNAATGDLFSSTPVKIRLK